MEEKIIAVKHQRTIQPIAYKTNLGNIYSFEKALQEVEEGNITNAYIRIDIHGNKHIHYKK